MCSIPSFKSLRLTSLSSRNNKANLRLRLRKLDLSRPEPLYLTYRSEIVGDYGSLPLYHMLGYFSLIGLLRVHVLLGDFTLALKVVENVELNQKVGRAHSSRGKRFLTCSPRIPSLALLPATSQRITMWDSAISCYVATPTRSASSCKS